MCIASASAFGYGLLGGSGYQSGYGGGHGGGYGGGIGGYGGGYPGIIYYQCSDLKFNI